MSGVKPEPNAHINLKVVSQNGAEVCFRIRRKTKFQKLIDAYCERQSINPGAIRFLYDGERIQADQTPHDLEMEDGDVIDALLQQQGGQ
eukprot:CAMPEP_0201547128 /NCGR_PEP_ID=MMETSP0173_2-20130828/3535_1 /ASSEMBLY_ACC=CAM_ASM_000268 /TAXON_ID=218659 /ORGANISM="Vexillifera sp., Strain DIVA3 564/2" /LENGTH=88 /DNA_ID=CAMNT_0047956053 /DNA_START=1567 /DNA_END=1833 /DNA_ORIENTATION=+